MKTLKNILLATVLILAISCTKDSEPLTTKDMEVQKEVIEVTQVLTADGTWKQEPASFESANLFQFDMGSDQYNYYLCYEFEHDKLYRVKK